MSARRHVAALALALAACGGRSLPPNGQLVVYVDTDAPLALAPGAHLGPDDATPLFDRLRIEIVDANGAPACAACADDFSVDRDQLARAAISFGVRPPVGATGLVVRARLFRGVRERGDTLPAGATLDAAMTFPPIAAEGIVEVTVPLMLDTLGTAADLAHPPPAVPGKAVRATLHDGLAPTQCTTDGGDGQVCVPGGAYWMSDPLVLLQSLDGDPPPERVAIVSPFWVDAGEVTVAALRGSRLASKSDPIRMQTVTTACTYTDAAGPNDSLPATCVSWKLAAQYCATGGGRLLTEAEFEFLAGGRDTQRYPWGTEDPACNEAIFARADTATATQLIPQVAECAGLGVGPLARGSGTRDSLALPGGAVLDLAGNVAEWTADVYQALGQDCWPSGVVTDPLCQPSGASPGVARTVRGGSWVTFPPFLRSTQRGSLTPSQGDHSTGFRCARPGR